MSYNSIATAPGSDLWKEARTGVITATKLSLVLGFSVPENAKTLGIKANSAVISMQRTEDCFAELRGSAHPDKKIATVAMEWGTIHELNCVALLLKKPKLVQQLQGYEKVEVCEWGLVPLSISELAPELYDCIPDIRAFPQLAASPDGELLCYKDALDTSPDRLALECKCPCPFIPNTGADDVAYQWLTTNTPSKLSPHYYAQVQLEMLVLGVQKALYMIYGPIWTVTFIVPLDMTWCRYMLQFVAKLHADHVVKGEAVTDSMYRNLKDYKKFLEHTKSVCNKSMSITTKVKSVPEPGKNTKHYMDK
jgi:hypothetical protein